MFTRKLFSSLSIALKIEYLSVDLRFRENGNGNKSCNLIGSLPGQYFPISAHGPRKHFRESPSTSLLSLPFFINISRFSGWAVFLSKDVSHNLKPINNLLILSFHSLKSLWLTEKYWFQNVFVLAIVSLRHKWPKTVYN